MIWLRFRGWLQEIDDTAGGVGVAVFEEVHRHLGTAAGHAYGGYLAHLTAWAEANRIPYRMPRSKMLVATASMVSASPAMIIAEHKPLCVSRS
jgi:crossover junction endodeoxyribonuclease RuvC